MDVLTIANVWRQTILCFLSIETCREIWFPSLFQKPVVIPLTYCDHQPDRTSSLTGILVSAHHWWLNMYHCCWYRGDPTLHTAPALLQNSPRLSQHHRYHWLSVPASLDHIDISSNDIWRDGTECVVGVLAQCAALTHIDIRLQWDRWLKNKKTKRENGTCRLIRAKALTWSKDLKDSTISPLPSCYSLQLWHSGTYCVLFSYNG